MRIAFNPSTVAALTAPPNNKDITFDLRGQNIFARGVKFCGTDTNTWRDIKINNVSIGSHTLDLRNGSNTTLSNTNGVVIINSTWRPVVDNLTSDSTTSSLSAKQGKVLKALIDGKSNSDHNHDGRYVRKSGDTMSGVLIIDTTNFGALAIKRSDDVNDASIQFRGKSSVYGYIGLNNSNKNKQFLRWNSDTSKVYTILDTSSTYTSGGKGVINGTTITQVDNATNATNSTNARKLVNWYSARPTSLNAQFGDGSLRIFYATSSTTVGKCPADATVLHLAWDNNGGWDSQLAVGPSSNRIYSRSQNNGTWQSWKTLAFTTDIPNKNSWNYDDRYYTKAESNAKYITDITTSVNKLTFTKNGSSIARTITVNNVQSLGKRSPLTERNAISGIYTYGTYSATDNLAPTNYFETLGFGEGVAGTIEIGGSWVPGGKLYWRALRDCCEDWFSWKTILDSSNYSSILDSRYYTESEVNSLLSKKLDRVNLSVGTWNPRGYNLAADYYYNGGDLSISENDGKMYVSIDGYFWQNGGRYRVLDISDVAGLKSDLTIHQYLSATDANWYPLIWGGSYHNNTSNSTGAVYKSHDVLSWQTSSQTLYATNIQTENIKHLSIGGGIYWNPNVESATDGSDAASITLVKSGVAGGTTLVLSQMDDANDTIQFKTSTAAKLYHNSYPILTTQNTYVNNHKGYIYGTEITQVNNSNSSDRTRALRYSGTGNSEITAYQTYSSYMGRSGWASYIICNHGDGSKYYSQTIAMPFWGSPIYRRLENGTDRGWKKFYTEEDPPSWDNVINKPSSFTPSSHTHTWASITDKLVAGNEFNIVNAGFKESMWFNYLPINDRSKTATISSYHFGNGAKGYTSIIASGFIKSGGNASQLLRADGGVAAFNWSGQSGQPTWLWGGNSQHSYYVYNPSNFRVAYAASAGNADTVDGYHATDGRTFNGNINWSYNWNDAWSDGTNKHPWYGFDHRYPNTGAYSTTISDFFGMTIKTANTLRLDCKDLLINGTNISNLNVASATNAYHLRINSANSWSTWYWAGQGDQPTWLWGSNDGTNMYVWNPSNFRVASATKLQTARRIWGQSFDGTTDIDNTLRIRKTTGNYCEGIRIQTGDGNQATIILGATADSGTNTNAWSIHRKSDNNFAISRNSSDGTNGLVMTSTGMGLGTTTPTQRLDVAGNIRATGQLYLPTNGNYNAILMGDNCWMGDCNISNVIGLSGRGNANAGGIKFGKGGMYIGYNGSNHYSSGTSLWSNFNADLLDGEHASAFTKIVGRHLISTNGTAPYNYIHLFRIANSNGYSTVDCEVDFRTRYHSAKLEIRISTNNPQYGNGNSSISIIKKVINGRSCNFWFLPTVQSSGYNYYDIYYQSGAQNRGTYDIILRGSNGNLVFEHKGTKLDTLPSKASIVTNQWVMWNDIAGKPSSFNPAAHNHDGRYLRLDGSDTMTGILKVKANQYNDGYDGAINMNNSDIYGLNSIYTSDKSESQAEGIHFWRDTTHVDTLRMMDGKLLFTPNRPLGKSGTEQTVLHTGNSSVSGQTITINGNKTTWTNTWRPLGIGANDAAAGNHTHDYLIINEADTNKFNSSYHNFQVLYAGEGNGIEGRPKDVEAFGLFRFRVAAGFSGQILLANGGDLYIRSAADASLNKSLPWKRVIDSGNIGSQSVAYASKAGSVAWANVTGKPTIPNPTDYYWANIKVSASSNTQTKPSVNTIYANNWFRSQGASGWYSESYGGGIYMSDTTWIRTFGDKLFYCNKQIYSSDSIRMGDIYLQNKNEINNGANGILYLNSKNAGNISLGNGGGCTIVGPYTTGDTGNNKLFVNGSEFIDGASNVRQYVYADGFRHRSHNSNDAVLLAGGGYSQGVPVRYWAIYSIYIGNSSTEVTYHRRGGNYDFIDSVIWKVDGAAEFNINFPSGYNRDNTLIFSNGDHYINSEFIVPVYVTITTNINSSQDFQIRVTISNYLGWGGFANIYFMCMG